MGRPALPKTWAELSNITSDEEIQLGRSDFPGVHRRARKSPSVLSLRQSLGIWGRALDHIAGQAGENLAETRAGPRGRVGLGPGLRPLMREAVGGR